MDAIRSPAYEGAVAPTDELDGLIGYHLRRASSLLMADLAERLAALGLRPAEASVLVVLRAHPRATQSEIGRRLSIKRANMAPLVAGLAARGFVTRAEPVGRAHPLTLSDTGAALAAAAGAQMAAHEGEFFGSFAPDERDGLRRLLSGLWRRGRSDRHPSTDTPE